MAALAENAAKQAVGDPMEKTTRLGAIVSEEQLERVLGYVEKGKAEGARLVRHERRGNRNVFRLERSGFDAARGWLEGFWDEALARFAEEAERTAGQGAP